ncbi:P-II family nitrogen regulator [Janthinobacterium agaricidamnosum]|uniref:Nitrogen regulatory P-II family protein n=1 Tax=Janthinobacterium agaricidamnosum NBRC 102515 = DSM 9628 TaxID=1349767 RepID=W0VCD2_9BURK|nr:P-II family nitrogen regulator [Janthinobacterium agaricidamnosum]CDG85325.1 nitrogen regulatory P-II family protein [Janthinobacterium agaricidamnosum NBRC 102515 = DSM 9628]
MKLVSATIRPGALDDVYRTLLRIGIDDMNATMIKTAGCQPAKAERYGDDAYLVGDTDAVRLDIEVSGWQVRQVIDAIAVAAGASQCVVHDLMRSAGIDIDIDINGGTDAILPPIQSMIEESTLSIC